MLSVSIKSAACASTCAKMELVWPSCIRGYHVYGENWTAVLGEELNCEREIGNMVDRYAVAVKKPDMGETVGHCLRGSPECVVRFYSKVMHLLLL